MNQYFDNTMLSAYKDCPRKFFLRHVLHWRSAGTALPLAFGLSWHSAMDVIWQHVYSVPSRDELARLALAKFEETWEGEGLPTDMDVDQVKAFGARTPSVAHEMLRCYIEKRQKILWEAKLLAAEQAFAVPLPGLDEIWYIGRLDKVIELNGQLLVIEHKTSSEYKVDGGFKSLYIESWYNDAQVKGYQYGGTLFFPGLSQVWVDAALVHLRVHDAFRFIPIAHQFPILQEWVEDTKAWIREVRLDTCCWNDAGKLAGGTFRRNENSCIGKYGACPFLNICRTQHDPSQLDGPPEGYVEEEWRPFEILGVDKILQTGEHNEQA